MKGNTCLILTILAVAATGITTLLCEKVWACGFAAAALLFLFLYYRSTVLPMRTIRAGMDLLRSQDFASRLSKVGQKDADEVVQLYNTIMANMKAERLRNLEQDNFLGKLIEASPTGIAVCSLDGNIERTNPAFKALESPLLLKTLKELPDEGENILRPGGAQVLRCSRLFFMDRGFRRTFFLVERLTDEIVRAETDIFHKIVRTIGHEVNNTLGGLASVLETMEYIHAGQADVCEALRSCRDSCFKLNDFVKGYSDVVKLPDAQPEAIDLNVFVNNSMPFLSKLCPPHVHLSLQTCDGPAMAMADTMLLQRVVVNIVKNAVESIGDRCGNIVLRTSPSRLEVIDDGPGIKPADAQKLFTPFFSTKRADRGLGLMLIADILRKHHADFSLATDDNGLTVFTIAFPAV